MKSTFRQIALIGKYHLPVGSGAKPSSKQALQSIAQFLLDQGLDVILEHDTASNTGIAGYSVMDVDGIGKTCDLALVVGGDGTMLGYGRQLAKYDVP
jgi:NAD+ kinase